MMLPIRLRELRRSPAPSDDGRVVARCLQCRTALVLHQPDPDAPDRLLATCAGCGSWHLVDLTEAVLILLPSCRTLRRGIAAAPRRSRAKAPLAG